MILDDVPVLSACVIIFAGERLVNGYVWNSGERDCACTAGKETAIIASIKIRAIIAVDRVVEKVVCVCKKQRLEVHVLLCFTRMFLEPVVEV